jgi:arginine utilization protein RocB
MIKIEDILEAVKPRPSFWLRVWLFFFLLINRKEGRRLIETLIEKVDEAVQKADEVNRKVEAYAKETDRRLKETQDRASFIPFDGFKYRNN